MKSLPHNGADFSLYGEFFFLLLMKKIKLYENTLVTCKEM